jgi:threonine synthase
MTGATIVYTEDSLQRWEIVKQKVREEGYATATNYLDPPVGSDPYGVEGYKTLGYELADDTEAATADIVVVPTSRGDLLWGIYRGLSESVTAGLISRMPRLVAAEPFPRIERVFEGIDVREHFPGKNRLTSIGGTTVTIQAVEALRRSGGFPVSVSESETLSDQNTLAHNGLYLELSSAAALTALRGLLKKPGHGVRRAVLIATSHGYKEVS